MVIGLERWRAHFADYADRYVLIGGVACDRLMEVAGLPFRATKDLDVVLLIEALDGAFATVFWTFVEAGGYEVRARAEGGNLYRFTKPAEADFPQMIELFSRAPKGFDLAPGAVLTPLPFEDAAASLSAILLDADYYAFLQANALTLEGLPLLSEVGLIPFKAKAYLDLSTRKGAGEPVDSKDVRKHRNDVFRLLQLLVAGDRVELPDVLEKDMRAFVAAIEADETFKPADIQVRVEKGEALDRLSQAYGLTLTR